MRRLAKMSGDVRDRAGFTFQAGREIKRGVRIMFVVDLHCPEAGYIHLSIMNNLC